MRWIKKPPAEPGQYRVRRREGSAVWKNTVTVWVDEEEGLMVAEDNGYIAWSQPMQEWLEENPTACWLGPLENIES